MGLGGKGGGDGGGIGLYNICWTLIPGMQPLVTAPPAAVALVALVAFVMLFKLIIGFKSGAKPSKKMYW